jgi:hypothetical protein
LTSATLLLAHIAGPVEFQVQGIRAIYCTWRPSVRQLRYPHIRIDDALAALEGTR